MGFVIIKKMRRHLKSGLKTILFSLLLLMVVFSYACVRLPVEHTGVTAIDGEIRVPVNEINDGKVHFFTYKKSGKRINFLVRTDGKGDISAYFDACFTCYKHKKGYRAEGTDLICNECGMKFRLADERWDNSQGCSPILLKSRIEKGGLIIMSEDAAKGGRLF